MNIEANRNEDWMKLKCSAVKQHFNTIKLGGGKKAIEKQSAQLKTNQNHFLVYKASVFLRL